MTDKIIKNRSRLFVILLMTIMILIVMTNLLMTANSQSITMDNSEVTTLVADGSQEGQPLQLEDASKTFDQQGIEILVVIILVIAIFVLACVIIGLIARARHIAWLVNDRKTVKHYKIKVAC